MRLSLNVATIVALIPLLNVTAAPVRGLRNRDGPEPQLIPAEPPTVFAYTEYGGPEPDIGKREATATLLGETQKKTKRQDSALPHLTPWSPPVEYGRYPGPTLPHCEGGLCDDNYPHILDRNVEKNKRQDAGAPDGGPQDGGAPTPITYDPYAKPHCNPGGICDVKYPQLSEPVHSGNGP